MDRFMLKDCVALVTGGGRGIGAACATLLAEAGASVAVLDIEAPSAEAQANKIRSAGGRAQAIACDVTDAAAVERAIARVIAELGGGAIVNIASIMGLSGGIYPNASYQASKGGVVNLTRALALEWASQGLRVNAVAPTFVRTALTDAVFSDPERSAAVMANTPLGVLPEPEDIAAAVLYLASPAARCVTGIVLPVDSGYLAR